LHVVARELDRPVERHHFGWRGAAPLLLLLHAGVRIRRSSRRRRGGRALLGQQRRSGGSRGSHYGCKLTAVQTRKLGCFTHGANLGGGWFWDRLHYNAAVAKCVILFA